MLQWDGRDQPKAGLDDLGDLLQPRRFCDFLKPNSKTLVHTVGVTSQTHRSSCPAPCPGHELPPLGFLFLLQEEQPRRGLAAGTWAPALNIWNVPLTGLGGSCSWTPALVTFGLCLGHLGRVLGLGILILLTPNHGRIDPFFPLRADDVAMESPRGVSGYPVTV